ncbi:copper chaperone PCu(A)C [Saccharopolyspora sp. SCSIO 74807]|uniref:copper chaperone PCu(A)C n=1 Tax=Saccharopolyspora sp. SCSIO 74807 TaxID=3118084 RepID=UPI0030CBF1B0
MRGFTSIALVAFGLGALTGCGGTVLESPSGAPAGAAGTIGTNEGVGQIKVRNVHLAATEAGYPPGSAAPAELFLINNGMRQDALVGARSPQAERVELRWDRGCDGQAEPVPQIPVTAQGTVPLAPGQPESATPYRLEVIGLERMARPGTTFPLTLTFAQAGDVRVDAKIQATRDGDKPPPHPCAAPPGPPATAPPPPSTPQGREFTAQGTVQAGPRPDCRLLSGHGRPYILVGGDPAVVRPGAEITVRGSPVPELRTPCGHGTTLHVLQAMPR